MKFVYLLGAPGAGKSTLAAELRKSAARSQAYEEPVPHIIHWRGGMVWYVELGKVRRDFSGTDALSMDIITRAEPWVRSHPARRMFAEGDRLANDRFFTAIQEAGYALTVMYIALPEAELRARQAQRAAYIGRAQDEAWARGRATKAIKLGDKWAATILDGTMTPKELSEKVRSVFYAA